MGIKYTLLEGTLVELAVRVCSTDKWKVIFSRVPNITGTKFVIREVEVMVPEELYDAVYKLS